MGNKINIWKLFCTKSQLLILYPLSWISIDKSNILVWSILDSNIIFFKFISPCLSRLDKWLWHLTEEKKSDLRRGWFIADFRDEILYKVIVRGHKLSGLGTWGCWNSAGGWRNLDCLRRWHQMNIVLPDTVKGRVISNILLGLGGQGSEPDWYM